MKDMRFKPQRVERTIDRIEVTAIEGGCRARIFVEGVDLPMTYIDAPTADEAEARALNVAIGRGWVLPLDAI